MPPENIHTNMLVVVVVRKKGVCPYIYIYFFFVKKIIILMLKHLNIIYLECPRQIPPRGAVLTDPKNDNDNGHDDGLGIFSSRGLIFCSTNRNICVCWTTDRTQPNPIGPDATGP